MYQIKIIEKAENVNILNESFEVFGRMIPTYDGKNWDYSEEIFSNDKKFEMCFPQVDFTDGYEGSVFVGAFDGDVCVGLSVLKPSWFRFMYIDDLKVLRAYRGKGVGGQLIEKSLEVAKDSGYLGVYTVGQDNNLAACRFYIKKGFEIGGLDNKVYTGTSQADKADIYFYKKL